MEWLLLALLVPLVLVPVVFMFGFIWKQEKEGILEEMVHALHHHLTPALTLRFKALSLSSWRGTKVPKFEFVDQNDWPTTVRIARDGTFRAASFGLVPDLEIVSEKSSSSAPA
jgi:hypothetical protein